MLGTQDPWIWLAYLLCLVATILCIAYGLKARYIGRNEDTARALEEDKAEERV